MELSGGERASFPCTGSFLFKEEFYGTTHKPILFVRISLLHAWLYHTGAFADKLSGSAFRLGKHHPTVFGIHSHAGHLCKDREGFGEGMFFPQTAELEKCTALPWHRLLRTAFISMIVVLTSPLQPNLVEQAMGELNDSSLFSMLFVIAVQPAVFEELLFRGAALHGYRSLGAKKALLMSALMFAMLHMNLQQALYAFLLGAIFAFMVQRTGSIFASMLPHFLINALNCVAATAQTPQQGVVEELSFTQELLSTGLQCLIFLPFLALLMYLFLRRNPAPAPALPANTDAPKEKIFTASFWIIVAIFIFFGVLPNLYWN